MTVRELISQLKTLDPNLQVAYALHSEYKLLESDELEIKALHPARPDGWIHDFWHRTDPARVEYLLFPGN